MMDLYQVKQKVRQGLNIRTDSRLVKEGDLYVVLDENRRYLNHAIQRGARYIVTKPEYRSDITTKDVEVICVSDTKEALGELASVYFNIEKQDFVLIGITGTNGKTTTAYLIEHLLKEVGLRVGVIGTINYRWPGNVKISNLTTPGCMELYSIISTMRKAGVDVVIMEVSSHGLSQDRVAGLKFDFAVFTNLTQDHLDYHKDMEDYFQAKSKLFLKYLRRRGRAVVNLDDPYGIRLKSMSFKNVLGFTMKGGIDNSSLQGEIVENKRGFQRIRCFYNSMEWEIDFPLGGRHNVYNLLAAQGIGLSMGIKKEVFKCFERMSQVPGRLEKVENREGLNIYIDYAHTPDALERVLISLKEMNFNRVVVVFGCGGDRDRTKRPLMGRAASKYSDVIIVTSDNPRGEDPEAIIEDILPGIEKSKTVIVEIDRKKAIKKGLSLISKQDVLLIAGKGHEDYQEINGVRYPFSDIKVVEEIINS